MSKYCQTAQALSRTISYPIKHVIHSLLWRRKMTVCIAVGCDCDREGRNPKIILMSDMLLSLGYTSMEMAYKSRQLTDDWGAMMAGDDISHALEIIDNARAALRKKDKPNPGTVLDTFVGVYQLIRKAQLENT